MMLWGVVISTILLLVTMGPMKSAPVPLPKVNKDGSSKNEMETSTTVKPTEESTSPPKTPQTPQPTAASTPLPPVPTDPPADPTLAALAFQYNSVQFFTLPAEQKKAILGQYTCEHTTKIHNPVPGTFFKSPAYSSQALGKESWIRGLRCAEHRVFSQNGEDGVVAAIFAAIGTTNRKYVEFGTEAGMQVNTRVLREIRDESQRWTGILLDGGFKNPAINLNMEFIYDHNIVSLFEKYGAEKEMDLLSVDTDCFDFWILRSILDAGYRPRVIIVEVNAKWATDVSLVIPPSDQVPGMAVGGRCGFTDWFGSSVAAYHKMAECYGYQMIYCDRSGVNCFMVRNDILNFANPENAKKMLRPENIWRTPNYGVYGWPYDPSDRPYLRIDTCDDIKTPTSAKKITHQEAIALVRDATGPVEGEMFAMQWRTTSFSKEARPFPEL
eukprot:TRINITY_DN19358_c0_g1_i1.p1 TRINITY_DN19358_c0_g1~~TRINITY_DN19358_c0_g1_i1.p1  ORF type:complete len:474 (+),score=94.08 TRINITY_DN19358_c0_g1_i1:105-1424(+)